jgi:LPS-assembly protein
MLFSIASEATEKFLLADKVEYNEKSQYIEAKGNVRIAFEKYVLHAEKMFYDIEKDELWAHGKVSAFRENEEIAIGKSALIKNKAKEIVISSFILYFKSNDSIIASKLAKRVNENHTHLHKATFTSCPTCLTKRPLWQISASKADVFLDKHKVVYKNMFFEIYGIPVMYLPYFAHSLPNAPPKSGILIPNVKNKKIGLPIYFRPKSNIDTTVTPRIGKKIFCMS